MLKRKFIFGTVFVLIFVGLISCVFAIDSINDNTLTPTVVDITNGGVTGNNDPGGVVISIADPDSYENNVVSDVVREANSNGDLSLSDISERLTEAGGSHEGDEINYVNYDRLGQVVDINYENDHSFNSISESVTINFPQATGQNEDDIYLVGINRVNANMTVIAPLSFDPITGTMTVVLDRTGPVMLIAKKAFVNYDTAPEQYPNNDLAEIVKSLSDTEYVSLVSFADIEDSVNKEIDITLFEDTEEERNISINPYDYEAVTMMSDVFVYSGSNTRNYTIDTTITANVYQDIERVDLQKILNYADIGVSVKDLMDEPEKLYELDPFVLDGSLLMQVDAVTGESNFIYEPTLSFVESNDSSLVGKVNSGRSVFNVKGDITKDSMVVSCENFECCGPWVLYIPKQNTCCWIWIILAVLIVLILVVHVVYKVRKSHSEN